VGRKKRHYVIAQCEETAGPFDTVWVAPSEVTDCKTSLCLVISVPTTGEEYENVVPHYLKLSPS